MNEQSAFSNLERSQVNIQISNKSIWKNNLFVIIAFFTSLKHSFDYGIKEKFPQNMIINSYILKVTGWGILCKNFEDIL